MPLSFKSDAKVVINSVFANIL